MTVDCGREIYVAWQLAKGKLLYRDVWYTYGPIAPYLNSILLRIFGVQLATFYGAGLINLGLCTALLFQISRRLLPVAGVFAVCGMFLLEAFQPGIFNFILPYAFASTYGCLLALLCLELITRAVEGSRNTVTWAGIVAGLAMLDKPEFGIACFGGLAFFIAWRTYRDLSWKTFAILVGSSLPGIILVAAVYGYFFSLRGMQFILAENFMSTPQSYFYQVFGRNWLEGLGAPVSFSATWSATVKAFRVVIAWLLLCVAAGWLTRRWRKVALGLGIVIVAGLTLAFAETNPIPIFLQKVRGMFLPVTTGMIATGLAIVSAIRLVFHKTETRTATIGLTAAMACLVGLRCLLNLPPAGYPIYHDALSFLCSVLVLFRIASFFWREPAGEQRWIMNGLLLMPLLACLFWVADVYRWKDPATHQSWVQTPDGFRRVQSPGPAPISYRRLQTPRGSIIVPDFKRDPYVETIGFMRAAAASGKSVLVLPEDVSLYFFADVDCPVRVMVTIPYVLEPHQPTTDYINELAARRVDYILLADRHSPEYHLAYFGRDYNQRVMEYINQHYREVKRIGHYSLDLENRRHWGVIVYQRNAD